MKYKNIGITAKTFYGVEIKPGQTKEVPGYINAPRFIRVDDTASEEKKTSKVTTTAKPVVEQKTTTSQTIQEKKKEATTATPTETKESSK